MNGKIINSQLMCNEGKMLTYLFAWQYLNFFYDPACWEGSCQRSTLPWIQRFDILADNELREPSRPQICTAYRVIILEGSCAVNILGVMKSLDMTSASCSALYFILIPVSLGAFGWKPLSEFGRPSKEKRLGQYTHTHTQGHTRTHTHIHTHKYFKNICSCFSCLFQLKWSPVTHQVIKIPFNYIQ